MVSESPTTVLDALPQTRPADEHNRKLVKHVHPPGWTNPAPAGRYNLVVIGAGTAGLVTAAGAAGLGAKVALVERGLMGGDCLNAGCVPSKALIRCARAMHDARDAARFGVHVPEGLALDFGAVMERMRRLRSQISHHDSATRFRELGVDVFLGEASFIGPDAIEVAGATLRFARACIATGTRPVVPPIEGLEEVGYLTNETLFSLTELPARLAVIGAGPIGCEMAQAFARFGTRVSLIETAPQILTREDRDAASVIEDALRHDGVELFLDSTLRRVQHADNAKQLHVASDGAARDLHVDQILLSVGRRPNIESLALEQGGIDADKRGVTVDDRLRTSNQRVYAAGDVCLPYKFTHTADATARLVIQNSLFFGRRKVSALTVPWCTYTDPEIAHVGMSAHEARDRDIDVDTWHVPLSDVDRAVLDGEEQGFLKVHTRKGKGAILGATLVARHAGEMISEVTAAMVAGAGLDKLTETIHCYPTQAEVIKKAADARRRDQLTPLVKKIFAKFLAWRR